MMIGGGIERVVCNLANAFAERGHEVSVVSFYQSYAKCPYELNEKVKLQFLKGIKSIFIKKPLLLRLYRKIFYRVVVAHLMKKLFKDFDIIIHNCFFYPYFKNPNTKYIKVVHMSFFHPYKALRWRCFDEVVLLCSKNFLQWQKYFKNISIIPNFIPTIPKESTNHAQKIVLSVGRLTQQKGFSRLIEIWDLVQKNQAFREWKLHIVGEGGLEQELREQISAKNLNDSIILKPFTKEIEKEYLSASIYVMTSLYEGFGMVLVESGSFALPSVAFDVNTGPSDIIEDSKTGFLIEDNALESFAEKLCVLMENQNLREQMGNAAKKRMQEKFSKEVVMEKWEELLDKRA